MRHSRAVPSASVRRMVRRPTLSRAALSAAMSSAALLPPPSAAGRGAPLSRFPLSFSQLSLHPSLLQGVKDLGFTRPTPIQEQAIPPALAGRDVLACAMTGSGKTAAFLLPILHHLMDKKRGTTR